MLWRAKAIDCVMRICGIGVCHGCPGKSLRCSPHCIAATAGRQQREHLGEGCRERWRRSYVQQAEKYFSSQIVQPTPGPICLGAEEVLVGKDVERVAHVVNCNRPVAGQKHRQLVG
jgi:hypothetical protein